MSNQILPYDSTSVSEIISFAKKLENSTLRKSCHGIQFEKKGNKGSFGNILEELYFKLKRNSRSEPDFYRTGLELKTGGLKKLKNGEFRAKERLVMNIINFSKIHKEDFKSSSFYKKNSHLLLVFHIFDKNLQDIDKLIKVVGEWSYSNNDLKIIESDWKKIQKKIKDGKAHTLSEGDTLYLGASTKGSKSAKSMANQPFSKIKAHRRAFSLKYKYINHVIACISGHKNDIYGSIINDPNIIDSNNSFEDIVIKKFVPYLGKNIDDIKEYLGMDLNKKNNKGYHAGITKRILGIELGKRIEEFEKAGIIVKTVRLKSNDMPDQHVSFPTFKFKEIINESWEGSDWKRILESKFFFIFLRISNEGNKFEKVKFWNMSQTDIDEAKKILTKTIEVLNSGRIVRKVEKNGTKKNFFPKPSENKIGHVRPHGHITTYELPTPDRLTGLKDYMKQSFWFNARYVRDEIFSE